uniref:Uncharacterized protein n=1 Tax=Clytia hemisphaerica TaxID=252671 RepID=A0A7M5XAD6_9CNID
MNTKLIVSCILVVILANCQAHFRIGKRSKFVSRQRQAAPPHNEILNFLQKAGGSRKICQHLLRSSNFGLEKNEAGSYVIDKLQSDVQALKSSHTSAITKYKALLELLEEYCLQNALNAALTSNEDASSSEIEDEVYRK